MVEPFTWLARLRGGGERGFGGNAIEARGLSMVSRGSSEHGPITRLDRVIWPVWVVSGLLAGLAFVVGVVLVGLLPGLRLFPSISYWLLAPCVLSDLCSLYVAMTTIMRRRGPSTVPLVSWGQYLLFCLFGLQTVWWGRLVALAALTLFHACCHFLIPALVARMIARRRAH